MTQKEWRWFEKKQEIFRRYEVIIRITQSKYRSTFLEVSWHLIRSFQHVLLDDTERKIVAKKVGVIV